MTRTLSAAGIVAIVLVCVKLSPYTFLMLVSVICIGAMLEFYRLARLKGAEPLDSYATIIGTLTVIGAFFAKVHYISWGVFLALMPLIGAIFIAELYRRKEDPFANIGWTLTGLIYVAVPLALLAIFPVNASNIGYIVYRPLMALSVFFIIWANDVGGYVFGLMFGRGGRHKLMERISPKKSWEGFAGGVLCAAGVGVLMSLWQGASLWLWGGAGLLIALAGVLGDLVESMLKRSADVKDSGSIIPGHGGWLDRFDAMLLAMPLVFAYFIVCFVLL